MFSTQLHAILGGLVTLDPQSTQIELTGCARKSAAAAGASFKRCQRIQTERTCRHQPGSQGTLASLATAPCVCTLCRVATSRSGLASTCCARRAIWRASQWASRIQASIRTLAQSVARQSARRRATDRLSSPRSLLRSNSWWHRYRRRRGRREARTLQGLAQ
jgi:hypothetical protein